MHDGTRRRNEDERSAPPSSEEGKRSAAGAPDPEVTTKALRGGVFTSAYGLSIIAKADGCETPGEIGLPAAARGAVQLASVAVADDGADRTSLRELGKKRFPMPSGGTA